MQDEAQPFMLPLSAAQVQLVAEAVNGTQPSRLRVLLAAAFSDELSRLAEIDPREQRLTSSLIHALRVLAVASGPRPVGVTEVARKVKLKPPSVARHLKTWVAVGVLEQDRASRRYWLAQRWRS